MRLETTTKKETEGKSQKENETVEGVVHDVEKLCSSALLWMKMEALELLLYSPVGTWVTLKTKI